MPKTTSTRVTRQTRRTATQQPQTRSQPARATKTRQAKGRGASSRQRPAEASGPEDALASSSLPDMSKRLTVPYVNPKELWESCTVPGHRYKLSMVDIPEFHEARQKMEDAWLGQTPEGEAPPVYSSIYSYNHEYLRIPKSTPVQPGVPSTSFGGAVRHMAWTEEMVNIILKAEFGDVELGHQFMKRFYEGSEVIGGSPDPKDPSIRYIPIPGRRYHMRLWTGRMDEAELVCWQFLDNKTKQPKRRPDKVKIYDVTDSSCPQRLVSLEEGQHYDETEDKKKPYSCDTFAAPDGSIVDFVHKGKPLMRIQLPNRPKVGPPKIEEYVEHKVLPVDPNQLYQAVENVVVEDGGFVIIDDGEEDGAQEDSDNDAD
ncbi:uncharacterized protein SCHCODRAFT_02619365 [Schizophyllum commune H4-8]|uniref:Uncharacterized protein n=1 Tax=Schizophyllum commune (strain H4-8 / FGSC 9210) TaxID=578458 RepID=D8Q1H1_SCHCM|nr:uncharacterized protein SCHCODRAFT_02619365 [Schizophyllum commune H4-8]KAI5895420.1 hypothetical protein SCHCODRAFT_02619365 [Schizophyllum commune H4-8]